MLGQWVTVTAARTLAGRLTEALGEPLPQPHGGPTPVPDGTGSGRGRPGFLGMPGLRRSTSRCLATALADGSVRVDADGEREEAASTLLALPGIGPWTAGYIRMRALAGPDVFLPSDAGVRHGLAALGAAGDPAAADRVANTWRPWRSYALHHLWAVAAGPVTGSDGAANRPGDTGAGPRRRRKRRTEWP